MYYHERGSRFTENVVFLARDQLRVERGTGNRNPQTREMSRALLEGSRLAVFDAADAGPGLALSCGQHIATQVGAAACCSARCMVPVMRNSHVYFEISTSPAPGASGGAPRPPAATLAVGLATATPPRDASVGACPGSVGLSGDGGVLRAGRRLPPAPAGAFGGAATVGCLVYLDDAAARAAAGGGRGVAAAVAAVTFNVDGAVVPPSPGAGARWPRAGPRGAAPTATLEVDRARELFPTVTLHGPGTCVMCRFSADDVLAQSRADVGAPRGVTVYAVDGSVVFDADEEDQFRDGSVPYHHSFVT